MTFRQGNNAQTQAQDSYWQGMYRPPSSAYGNGSQQGDAQARQDGAQSQPGEQPGQQPGQANQQQYGQQPYNPQYQQQYGQPPYGQPYNQPYGQPYGRPVAAKDHIAAALLAIFLGCLGVHKFYLGYNQAGFIMLAVTVLGSLFTFGLALLVMEVIAFIEGVIYLTKSQQEFDNIYVYGHKEWF